MYKHLKNRKLRKGYISTYKIYRDNRILLLGTLFGSAIIIGSYYLMFNILYVQMDIEDSERAGQFGDMFGSVNSLFSALAFLVIAISLFLQKNELALQRKQLKLQRKDLIISRNMQQADMAAQKTEMQNQRDELKLTREIHARNNFEGKLMFLLKNLERQIEMTKGTIFNRYSLSNHILEGFAYWDELYLQTSELVYQLNSNPSFTIDTSSAYFSSLAKAYGINTFAFYESWKMEDSSDFCKSLIEPIHDNRKREYFNAWLTFNSIIKMLRNDYAEQILQEDNLLTEVQRNFEAYLDLVKSTVPFSTRILFLYFSLIKSHEVPRDFITNRLYRDIASADFFHVLHKDLITTIPNNSDKG